MKWRLVSFINLLVSSVISRSDFYSHVEVRGQDEVLQETFRVPLPRLPHRLPPLLQPLHGRWIRAGEGWCSVLRTVLKYSLWGTLGPSPWWRFMPPCHLSGGDAVLSAPGHLFNSLSQTQKHQTCKWQWLPFMDICEGLILNIKCIYSLIRSIYDVLVSSLESAAPQSVF